MSCRNVRRDANKHYDDAEKASRLLDITLTQHMRVGLWKKFVLLSGTSGITASTRQPMGVIREDEDMPALFYRPIAAWDGISLQSQSAQRRHLSGALHLRPRGLARCVRTEVPNTSANPTRERALPVPRTRGGSTLKNA